GCRIVWRLRRVVSESVGGIRGALRLLVFRGHCHWLGSGGRGNVHEDLVSACTRGAVDGDLRAVPACDQSFLCWTLRHLRILVCADQSCDHLCLHPYGRGVPLWRQGAAGVRGPWRICASRL